MATKAPLTLRVFQLILWSLVLLAIGYMVVPRFLPTPQTPEFGPGVPLSSPFTLLNQNGESVTEAAFANKAGAWFYGFTNCPDVCPTALAEMGGLLKALGDDAAKLNAVFVTVDPERDTVLVMKEYVGFFDPRIVGLTGELSAVEAMAKSRFIYFSKVPKDDGSYVMDHSASIYLTNAEGEFVGTLDAEEPLETKLAKLKRLLNNA